MFQHLFDAKRKLLNLTLYVFIYYMFTYFICFHRSHCVCDSKQLNERLALNYILYMLYKNISNSITLYYLSHIQVFISHLSLSSSMSTDYFLPLLTICNNTLNLPVKSSLDDILILSLTTTPGIPSYSF